MLQLAEHAPTLTFLKTHGGSNMRHGQPLGVFVSLLLLWQLSPGTLLAADPRPAVSLAIDYGDDVELRFRAIPWRSGMTVLDALATAGKHPRGIKFVQRGRGATAMITEIDGLKNDPAGKNWLFSVNGKSAEVGAGAYELKPDDAVLWEFKPYE
jgi:hypothetical protein